MLAAFPLTTARDRGWWNNCQSLGSPEISTSFFTRQLQKGAVDLLYTPVDAIASASKQYIIDKEVIVFSAFATLASVAATPASVALTI